MITNGRIIVAIPYRQAKNYVIMSSSGLWSKLQFLIGRLKTKTVPENVWGLNFVAIPYRQAKNEAEAYKAGCNSYSCNSL